MVAHNAKYAELICLIQQILNYYHIQKEPTIKIVGQNIEITLYSDELSKIESIARHLKILGFKDTCVLYDENMYVFSNKNSE